VASMVKSQLLDGSASGIGNRKAQSQMQLHDTHLFQTARSNRSSTRLW